jgi:Predicted membrane protein (DUF2142)
VARPLPVALTCAGFGLFLLAWVFASVPYRPPDEKAHYLRVAAIAGGTLLGPRTSVTAATPAQTAYVKPNGRAESVDARLAPPGLSCVDGKPVPAAGRCAVANYTGNYLPLPYLIPALAVHWATNASTGLWLGRLASAAQCLLFVGLAFALLWRGSAWSVLGLLGALTPSFLFVSSVINPDGLELATSLAFASGLVRISDTASERLTWAWAAVALSGAVAILSWQLGWLFVAAGACAVGALLGAERLTDLVRANRRAALLTGITLAVAFALFLAWSLSTGLLHSAFGISPVSASLRAGVHQLRAVLHDAVGLFGSLDVSLPSPYYWVWWSLVLGLVAVALKLGTRPERTGFTLVAVLVLAFPVLFYAWVYRHSGFILQARYVMPLLALIPVLGGELVFRRRGLLPGGVKRFAPSVAIAVIACYQLAAWWINARTSAAEPHAFWFPASPHWSPPGGWAPWLISALLGTLLLIACAALSALGVVSGAASPAGQPESQLLGSPSP